ncbi:MAG: hypothetical protein COT73_12240 [Bdellovibrio sp. CG10_big_fil_rev_8_21_14_0_10_47_8]|nr:MAG: hypothetical protein COT73_12240 [Bdellovibrio sp. CG10_big_fil_rev_8_21_14_0_10_47_8]
MRDLFVSHLVKNHPSLAQENLSELVSPQLLSPYEIRLPASVLKEAQSFVEATYLLRESAPYQKYLSAEIQERGLSDPGNKSICMSYDFHVTSTGGLKLIEVNTNAAFLAMGYEMYQFRQRPLPVADFDFEEIKRNILLEMSLNGKSSAGSFSVAIIDEEPTQQRMYIEFLVYKSWFEKWGWPTEIYDYRNVNDRAQFIYNRLTDFYLSDESSRNLKDRFLKRDVCLSPNPFEYLLLADKQRMIDWSLEKFWQDLPELSHLKSVVQKSLCLTKDLDSYQAEDIWAQRKGLFLKPKRAFGAKQSYRGASISRKAFDEITGKDFIAQEYIPAPEVTFKTPEGPQTFKYDLRFYVYQNRIQIAVARIYQGQVTNLRTPGGGFAPIIFE